MKRLALAVLACALLAVFATRSAHAATSCSASMSNVQFGSSDPFTGWTDVTATLTYSCETSGLLGIGLKGAKVKLCFSIGSGAQGTGSINPRRLVSSTSELQFNLYKDVARTQIWGTLAEGSEVPVSLEYSSLLGDSSGGGTLTAYARIPSGQSSTVPGTYSNAFSGIHTELRYQANEGVLSLVSPPSSCTSGGTQSGTAQFSFTASATATAKCSPSFTVQNLDFGNQGLLKTTIDTTASMAPRCTNTTPYQIGLDNGLYASGNTRRMRSGAGDYVSYELYRDAGRSNRWGNTLNVDTLMETGTGSTQSVPIYGRVTPQNTPPAGSYSDTVTVTITY